jgi:hypothetical protein
MPEVAANAVEAVLSEWPIPENTPFRSADSIATVETEKAVVEVTRRRRRRDPQDAGAGRRHG